MKIFLFVLYSYILIGLGFVFELFIEYYFENLPRYKMEFVLILFLWPIKIFAAIFEK